MLFGAADTGLTSLLEASPHSAVEAPTTVLPVFDTAVEADPSYVGHVRRLTGVWLKLLCGMEGERADLVLLVVSELCTNAILHAQAEAFGLRGRLKSDGHVRIEVHDWSPSAAPRPRSVGPMNESGRGLFLVKAFVTQELGGSWGFSEDGAVAWCEVPLSSSHSDRVWREPPQ
ncbi:ATP-binding protein [Streptomyces sp. NPDC048420]|uniref:ATP-binding protein n=1 Tax=Streptomyces sp. NPDC048420 TaxID=3155755 RepID=UPI003437554D